MKQDLVAKVSSTVEAPIDQVWQALITPETIKEYMFGAAVKSDWKVGSPIVWKGEWKGKPFEDKGRILEVQQGKRLRYSHFVWHLFVLAGTACHFCAIFSCAA